MLSAKPVPLVRRSPSRWYFGKPTAFRRLRHERETVVAAGRCLGPLVALLTALPALLVRRHLIGRGRV